MFSEDVQAEVLFTQLNVLSVVPLRVIPPPSAVTLVGEAIEPNSIFLSSTVKVVELIVVVVPLTVKSPDSVNDVPDTAPVNVAPAAVTAPALLTENKVAGVELSTLIASED